MEMSIKRDPGAEDLLKEASELPVAYPYAHIMRYAYYSVDGMNFSPIGPPGYSHDIMSWPSNLLNVYPPEGVRCVYTSTEANAIDQPNAGSGMGFCAGQAVGGGFSHRVSYSHLSVLFLTGAAPGSGEAITDENWHTVRRMMGVGNLNTFRAVYQEALATYPDWGWDSN